MPLKRTPPSTPVTPSPAEKEANSAKSTAQPEFSCETFMVSDNVTTRKKGKCAGCSKSCMDEIRSLLRASAEQSDSKFASIQSTMGDITAQNTTILQSITFMSQQYDDMVIKIENLESDRKLDSCHIKELEEKVENLERMLYSTKIEIKNIPKKLGECTEDLYKVATDIASVLELPLQRHEVKDIFRTGKTDSMSSIVVDFVSVITKQNIIKKTRHFNNNNKQNKLNTTHLKMEGPGKPIYLSEKLTPKNQRLYYLARNFAKDNEYKYCWTSYGKVYLRQDNGRKPILINCEEDLSNLHLAK